MNRKIIIVTNWLCFPIVAPLALVVYACAGLLAHRAGWAAYRAGLVNYLKGEI